MEARAVSEKCKLLYLLSIALFLVLLAFALAGPQEIWRGSLLILVSPANLLTDYFQLAGIGATLLNAGMMMLASLAMVRLSQVKITGAIIAGLFTVAGFAFFGKNLYNSFPIILGVLLYARTVRTPFNRFILHALFGTSLSPLVSEISFNLQLPLPWNWILGMMAGLLAGWVIPPLSMHFLKFHQGYNLYNIGFTAGIVGMFFLALLKAFGIDVATVAILSSGNNLPVSLFLLAILAGTLLLGLYLCRWKLRGYRQLLRESGILASDFTISAGFGLTLINIAVLGLIALAYVLLLGGELNGPVIGGILTVCGFGAFGKHPRNVLPILAGVFLANVVNIHDYSATVPLIAALFGTTLAPVAGQYGFFWGMSAGFLHMAIVTNVPYLHGGMNLYNNGFAGGFIAAALVPLIEVFRTARQERRRQNVQPAHSHPFGDGTRQIPGQQPDQPDQP